MSLYPAFLPAYYSQLIKAQQQSIFLDNIYFYVADGLSKNAIANNNPKTIQSEQAVVNEILYGCRALTQNIIALVRKIPWVSGKVFAQYESRDPSLSGKDFFCIASNRAVYKCISNNKGSPSTVEPSSLTPGSFQLADGYIWIYLYKLTENQLLSFEINGLIPLITDPATTAASVRGTISTINVLNGGNYDKTNIGVIQSKIDDKTYRVSDTADPVSGIYDDMSFYVSTGPGSGALSQITTYTSNSSGKYVVLKDDKPTVTAGSMYEIAPFIKIEGNGFGGSARAIMNGRAIDKIEVLHIGSEFTLATASPIANNAFNVPATLEVNLSPIKGHGGDVYQELYCENFIFNIDLDNYDFDPQVDLNEITFAKTGLIRFLKDEEAPFANSLYTANTFSNLCTVAIQPSFGDFTVGDTIKSTASENPKMKIVQANNTHIVGVYESAMQRFSIGGGLVNQDGVTGTITDIKQPEVRFFISDVVSVINTDTIVRSENASENLQLLIKIRDDITPTTS